MKRVSIVFLQAVIILIGIGVLTFMLWEPHIEGRNADATLFEIYFKDPFLAYVYVASIPFFVILYQAFRLLLNMAQNRAFTQNSVRALQTIKYCAIVLVLFIMGAEVYFLIIQRGKEDIAGGAMIGLFLILVSAIISAAATVFEKTIREVVDTKSA